MKTVKNIWCTKKVKLSLDFMEIKIGISVVKIDLLCLHRNRVSVIAFRDYHLDQALSKQELRSCL